MTTPPKPAILVSGSAMLAWDLIHRTGGDNTGTGFEPEDSFMVYRQSGGAWHVTMILRRMKETAGWSILGVDPVKNSSDPPPHHQLSHAYAKWTDFARSHKDEKSKAVRVKGYLGTEVRRIEPPKDWFSEVPTDETKEMIKLVIATEMGNGASTKPDGHDVLTGILNLAKKGNCPWILWKYEGPTSDLFHGLSAGTTTKTALSRADASLLYNHAIALVPVSALRRGKHRLGHGLSWENLVRESLAAVAAHNELSRFRWVIVSFNHAGALIVPRPNSKARSEAELVYDPAEMERTWLERYPGEMVGSATCLVAAVARATLQEITKKLTDSAPVELVSSTISAAAKDGLLRMRALHYLGYFAGDKPKYHHTHTGITDDEDNPTTRYAAEPLEPLYADRIDLRDAISPKEGFRSVKLLGGGKTILELPPHDAEQLARDVAENGPRVALVGVPRAAFGDLITTEPSEIEALLAIDTLIRGYVHDPGNKPLSLAVFGQPGSGKSFGVKQIVRQLKGVLEDRTFNLSQFEDPSMLVGALHQVRDIGLRGKIPLVFWDEFDTSLAGEERGWLRYFLAPMQDGEFQEDQVTHPIGRAVFVFAGGTCEQMKDFHSGLKTKLTREALKRAKVPDFVSRLRGYLDVPGLNLRGAAKTPARVGAHLKVRRAVVLHAHLRKIPGIAEGDAIRVAKAVVNAFLEIPEYLHGARSIEAIVRMSALRHVRTFTTSCLPSEDQLNLHVNGRAFLALASA
jgi:hypothetical protein